MIKQLTGTDEAAGRRYLSGLHGDLALRVLPVHHPLKLMSIESVMPSSHLILCCPLFLLPSLFPSISYAISTYQRLV